MPQTSIAIKVSLHLHIMSPDDDDANEMMSMLEIPKLDLESKTGGLYTAIIEDMPIITVDVELWLNKTGAGVGRTKTLCGPSRKTPSPVESLGPVG